MKNFKKMMSFGIIFTVCISLISCSPTKSSPTNDSTINLNVAYQYGLAYAPLVVCQENELIEKAYADLTGKSVNVIWNQMNSGADINVGIASNSIDVGFMGIAPAITGISKNVGYKIFTNLSGQEHGLMCNKPTIQSLDNLIDSSEQIALVNTGSIQHIILGLALDANGYDAHTLDSNIVAMKHPDGMTAIESGNIATHLTSNPYIYKERANSSLHELTEVKDVWNKEKTFIVGIASNNLYENNPELYNALCKAISESIDMINSDPASIASVTCEYDGNSYEEEVEYLKAGSYNTATTGIFELSRFMYDNKFIEAEIKSYSELVFDNVTGD